MRIVPNTRRRLFSLAVVPLAVVALVLGPSPAQAAPHYDGQIRNAANQKCLDVRREDAYTVQLWSCANTWNQLWIYGDFTVIDGVNYAQILNMQYSNTCLQPAGGALEAEVPVVVVPCATTDAQLWAVHDPHSGAAYLVNKRSGLCLDLRYNSSANNTIIWQYWCILSDAQWWTAQFGGW